MQQLYTENAPKMVGKQNPSFKSSRKEGIDLTTIEPNRPDKTYSENLVGKVKLADIKIVVRKLVPLRL